MDYTEKEKQYYKHVRLDLLTLLPDKSKDLKILEIGAGYGATLSYLKNKKIATETIGVDIPSNKGTSPYKNIDAFFYEDIEKLNLEKYNNYFDCIIFADVLEHLVSPEKVLQKVKKLLNKNGFILVSIPNFRHYYSIKKVFLKGDFSYEESGLFDFTHLRFFCKKNIKQLLENNGFEIEKICSSLPLYKQFSISKVLNIISFGVFEQFLTVQYLVKAKRK